MTYKQVSFRKINCRVNMTSTEPNHCARWTQMGGENAVVAGFKLWSGGWPGGTKRDHLRTSCEPMGLRL